MKQTECLFWKLFWQHKTTYDAKILCGKACGGAGFLIRNRINHHVKDEYSIPFLLNIYSNHCNLWSSNWVVYILSTKILNNWKIVYWIPSTPWFTIHSSRSFQRKTNLLQQCHNLNKPPNLIVKQLTEQKISTKFLI